MHHSHIAFHRTLTGGPQLGWPETLVTAAQAGFDRIDIDLLQIPKADYPRAKDSLAQLGIQAGVALLPAEFRGTEDRFSADMQILAAQAALAKSLGIRTMVRSLPPCADLPKPEYAKILKRRLRIIANTIQQYDIRLALEFIGPIHLRTLRPYPFIWRMDETLEFAAAVGAGTGLLIDAWHWHHIGATKQDILSAGDMILNVQIADAAALPPEDIRDEQRLLPGQGCINFAEFFQALHTIGYQGFITPEVFGYHPEFADPVLAANQALTASKDLLAKTWPT
ncbi:sugar phosphate isomerase/epimerase [Methylomonas paludis]|uniref:Sugar phosphate isomerase/epimerase n=1 Tax=Methylomonas paludis TaxID=1173101 RepID=A0A975MLR6_9GAMM|nr:TIM barrel protein [Methylomonas paludis]QWF69885.1 sugar phosphate isomerase/epimerase [Methylomonas paludis]